MMANDDSTRIGPRRTLGFVRDPAAWAWAIVALLALLPLRTVLV